MSDKQSDAVDRDPTLRLGLCCLFRDEPIKFASTTAKAIGRPGRADGLAKPSRLCLVNADALMNALRFCSRNRIGCFRIIHVSSPLEGWDGPRTARHHDFIDLDDFPDTWFGRILTVEVEAKAKEAAALALRNSLRVKEIEKSTRDPDAKDRRGGHEEG